MRLSGEVLHEFKTKQEGIKDYDVYLFPWRSKKDLDPDNGIIFFITWCKIQGLPLNAALHMVQPIDLQQDGSRISFKAGKHTFYFQTEAQRDEFSTWMNKQSSHLFSELPRNTSETFAMVYKFGYGFNEITTSMVNMRVWIDKNCQGNVYYYHDYFFFANPADAVKFKLAWG